MTLDNLKKYAERNEATYARKGYRGLNLFGKLKFTKILVASLIEIVAFNRRAIKNKECYLGPFVGEFGNFLLHILPYISYLHCKGVKIYYCGLDLHKPLLVNEKGQLLAYKFFEIHDFFKDSKPSGNNIEWLPEEVKKTIEVFEREAMQSGKAFLNLGKRDLYWFVFRNWQLSGRQVIYDLSQVYGGEGKKKKCVIFPRKMTVPFTKNNGGRIDYKALANELAFYFDDVVFIGHPEFSDLPVDSSFSDRIRYSVTGKNIDVLNECASAELIVTQHSGAIHVGGYTRTPVFMLFLGQPPIQGLDDSIRFRKNFGFKRVSLFLSTTELIEAVKKRDWQ